MIIIKITEKQNEIQSVRLSSMQKLEVLKNFFVILNLVILIIGLEIIVHLDLMAIGNVN